MYSAAASCRSLEFVNVTGSKPKCISKNLNFTFSCFFYKFSQITPDFGGVGISKSVQVFFLISRFFRSFFSDESSQWVSHFYDAEEICSFVFVLKIACRLPHVLAPPLERRLECIQIPPHDSLAAGPHPSGPLRAPRQSSSTTSPGAWGGRPSWSTFARANTYRNTSPPCR